MPSNYIFCFIIITLSFIVSCDRKPDAGKNVASKSLNDDQNQVNVSDSLDDKKREQMNSEFIRCNDPNLLIEKFKGPVVKNYASKIYPSREYWGTAILRPPSEYSDVVKAGKTMLPSLIQLLTSDNENTRVAAFMALVEITNNDWGSYKDFYYDKKENLEKRKQAVEQWKFWWNNNKNKSRAEWLLDDLGSKKEDHRIQYAIIELGILKEKSAIPALRKLLDNEKLRMDAAKTLAILNDGYAIPYLIKMYLTDDLGGYRKEGIELLKNLTSLTFDYDPKAPEKERNKSIKKWEQWWEENKSKYLIEPKEEKRREN